MFSIAKPSFKLEESFLEKFRGTQPKWGPLGYITYKRTYARPMADGRTEEFVDTLERVVNGTFSIQKNHCIANYLSWNEEKAQRTAQKMFLAMWDFKFLPPGRGLWSMGTEHVVKNGGLALNNCAFVQIRSAKDIGILMDMLMLGVGVGFDTQTCTLNFPHLGSIEILHTVEDSREGWVKSVIELVEQRLKGNNVVFDYSLVRKAGTPIKGFGGTASGPEPLASLHDNIKRVFNNRRDYNHHRATMTMTSVDILDICNLIGKCVVAGNVRRSAEIALGSYKDDDFVKAKLDMDMLVSHRWASNNSIVCEIGMDYDKFGEATMVNGEPGYIWLQNATAYGRMASNPDYIDSKVVGVNPCSEQTLENYEVCCLVETFPRRHESLEEYMDTLKLAYLYAKTVTLVHTHIPETNDVMLRNRRIGCSQSGIVGAFNRHGRRRMLDWCDQAYSYVKGLDAQYSSWLCVPRSIKVTSVKPSGTVSLLPGETPGIHYPHSEYYIRRIRFSSNSNLIPILREAGYEIEPDVTNPDNTMVVSFPVREYDFDRSKDDVSMWEQLENAAQYQAYWADNAVSVTITFNKEEGTQIPYALELYEKRLKAVSFLPISEHGYQQAPYETIDKVRYDEMKMKIKPYFLNASGNNVGSSYCDGDKCVI